MISSVKKPTSTTARRRRRLLKLWYKHPYCHWCGCITILQQTHEEKDYPLNAATIDHLYSRLHPNRQIKNTCHGETKTVLACWKCNHQRGKTEVDQTPVEILRQRAKEGMEKKKIQRLANQQKLESILSIGCEIFEHKATAFTKPTWHLKIGDFVSNGKTGKHDLITIIIQKADKAKRLGKPVLELLKEEMY